jgi:hypothetical protein
MYYSPYSDMFIRIILNGLFVKYGLQDKYKLPLETEIYLEPFIPVFHFHLIVGHCVYEMMPFIAGNFEGR